MAAALDCDIAIMETASEGGAWGAAILAAYAKNSCGLALEDYLQDKVFASTDSSVMAPDKEDVEGFKKYIEKYKAGLLAQKVSPFEACKLGVYLHSRAGEIASEELTEYSVLASDLPKYLHKAIKEIL